MRLDSYLDGLDIPPRTRLVTGRDLVAQRIRLRLATHEGEILRDTSIGFPWATWLSTKPPPLASIRSSVRKQLGQIAGVTAVGNVQASASGGTISVSADVETDEGSVSISAAIASPDAKTMSFTADFWGGS